jgi:hypothetical protein
MACAFCRQAYASRRTGIYAYFTQVYVCSIRGFATSICHQQLPGCWAWFSLERCQKAFNHDLKLELQEGLFSAHSLSTAFWTSGTLPIATWSWLRLNWRRAGTRSAPRTAWAAAAAEVLPAAKLSAPCVVVNSFMLPDKSPELRCGKQP